MFVATIFTALRVEQPGDAVLIRARGCNGDCVVGDWLHLRLCTFLCWCTHCVSHGLDEVRFAHANEYLPRIYNLRRCRCVYRNKKSVIRTILLSLWHPPSVLCRNNKRRATNVKVTKRAAPQNSNAYNNSNSGGGQEDGSGQDKDKEFMGVVSLVQLERHYGFIEVCKEMWRLGVCLSEVLFRADRYSVANLVLLQG